MGVEGPSLGSSASPSPNLMPMEISFLAFPWSHRDSVDKPTSGEMTARCHIDPPFNKSRVDNDQGGHFGGKGADNNKDGHLRQGRGETTRLQLSF